MTQKSSKARKSSPSKVREKTMVKVGVEAGAGVVAEDMEARASEA